MKCQEPGYIQEYIDGQLDREERKQFALHLQECSACRSLLVEATRLENWSEEVIGESFPLDRKQIRVDVELAWREFQQRLSHQESSITNEQVQRRWPTMKSINKKWVSAAATAAIVLGSLSFSEVRAMAEDFLSVFRVDKVEFVKITESDLREIHNWLGSTEEPGVKEIKGIGKLWVDEKEQPHRALHFANAEAAAAAGYPPAPAPKGFEVENISTNREWTLHAQLDTEKANKFFKQLNSDARFDDRLNGKQFSITIPQNIKTEYRATKKEDNSLSWFTYTVADAPKIKVPEGADLDQLRSTFLKLPFIPANVKQQLAKIEDWKRTLPLPYIGDQNNMKEISVQGTKGILIDNERLGVLLWSKNGKMYQIENHEPVANRANALVEIANQMN